MGRDVTRAHRMAPSGSPHEIRNESERSEDQKYKEQDLRDAHGTGSDAAKAKYRGDQSDDEENYSVVQHGDLRCASCPGTAPVA